MNDPVSEELAKLFGFEKVEDQKAHDGVCYMKGGKIWIHNRKALMTALDMTEDEDHKLVELKYDVKAYYDSREDYKRLCFKYTQEAFEAAL